MIMDSMHQATDKRIKMLENRLAKEYKQAEREMKRKAKEFMASFKKKDIAKKKLVDNGELTKFEWIEWRKRQLFMSDLMQKKTDIMTQQLMQTNLQATNIVNGQLAEVYAKHYNFAFYQLEKGLGINTSFTLYDANTVERLASKNPRLLPKKKLNTAKDAAWSKRKINNAIMQGVLQGEPLDDIAERLSKVAEMSWSAAVRTARTAMTGAQNAGRLDSLKRAEDMGIKVHKQWMATLDEHTRESHAEIDGESVPVDEPFSNGLMYPADPDGDPAEVYNCRCTMVGDLVDYNEEYERYDNIEGEPIENMTYKEWEAAKARDSKDDGKTATSTTKKALISLERIEREDRHLNYERGAVVARDGTIAARYDGKEHTVEVSDSDLKQMSGKIFTHNHPSGNFFSDNDIITGFIKTDLYELRASTPDGVIYSLKNNGVTKESARKFLADYNQTSAKATRMAQEHLIRKVKMGELSMEEYKRNYYKLYMQYRDEMLIRMAREKASDYGLIFEVIKP